jgi:hypothetical protein
MARGKEFGISINVLLGEFYNSWKRGLITYHCVHQPWKEPYSVEGVFGVQKEPTKE